MPLNPVKVALKVQSGLSPVCATKESRREYMMLYREKNREKLKAEKQLWHKERMKDPEYRKALSARSKKWREYNPDRHAALMRSAALKRKYGLTVQGYNDLLEGQGGGCAICGSEEVRVKGRDKLFVDHDHATGRVRGLLCNSCNLGVAQFKDDPALLQKAICYLGDEE